MWLSNHWLLAGVLAWVILSVPFGIWIGTMLRAADEAPAPEQPKAANEEFCPDSLPQKSARS